jgi:DNA-binding response OmpR family regulator
VSHRLLLVEDETPIREGLADRFGREGFAVTATEDGESALEALAAGRHDLVVLDLMLPGLSGEEVLVKMRERGDRTPVLVLSARGQEIDRVLLLTLGADDYVVKPFSTRELVARMRAIIRRAEGTVAESLRIGDAVVDLPGFRILRGGEAQPITTTERGMLSLLLAHRGTPVSRDEFLRKVWGYDRIPDTRTVDFHIVRLRRKLEADPAHPRFLRTVRGAGYVLDLTGGA